jgi:hypothetical protein
LELWVLGFKTQPKILEDFVRAAIFRRKQLMTGLQSSQVKEIYANLAPSEHEAFMHRVMLYTAWILFAVCGPAGVFSATFFSRYFLLNWGAGHLIVVRTVCIFLVGIHCACIPLWMRAQRRFFCSTEWARSHDLQPDRLKLFFD